MDWIKVDDVEKVRNLQGLYHFLVLIGNDKKQITDWVLLTGEIDEDGGIYDDGVYTEWDYRFVEYYKPVGELPPLPAWKPFPFPL